MSFPPARLHHVLALSLWLVAAAAQADRADRSQPLAIEADKPGTVDMLKQVVTFNGNVVVTQGTMRIHAERVELRESPDGHRSATALGAPGQPATFRQKREGLDEFIEGAAARIEYDSRSEVLKLLGNASVRRTRGSVTADQITGNVITYDNAAELFSVAGDGSGAPGGRVRAVLTPPPPASGASR